MASLANAEQQHMGLYEEEDQDTVVMVGYATSPTKEVVVKPEEVEEMIEEFVDDFGDDIHVTLPNLTAPDLPIDQLEPPLIEFEVRTHKMWTEACSALRWFGTLVALPLEVQLQIVSLLGPTTLLTLRHTCKFGMLIGEQDKLWERLILQDFPGYEIGETEAPLMEIYQSLYHSCISGEARSMGFPSVHWKYAKNKLWKINAPHQVWTFDPRTNYMRSPSFKTWIWLPNGNRLIQGALSYSMLHNRFLASDRPSSAMVSQRTAYPPTMRLACIGSGHFGWQITGKIPIPFLLVIVFNPDS